MFWKHFPGVFVGKPGHRAKKRPDVREAYIFNHVADSKAVPPAADEPTTLLKMQ
jgi:hypothetical protein